MRRDIEIRNRLILRLYVQGVTRKQIIRKLPQVTYDTVRKALNKSGIFEWHRKPKP